MKRVLFLSAFVILVNTISSQDIPAKLNNIKTDKYVNVLGTDVWMIPPAGYTSAPGAMNLKKDDSNIIQVMLGENFDKASAEMTIARFEKENTVVNEYKYFKLNGYNAKFFWLQDVGSFKNYMLIFGDSNASTLIMAKYNADDKKAEKALRKAILSTLTEKVK